MRFHKHLLLWSSLGTLLVLGWAAYAENFRAEWRRVQAAARSRLPRAEAAGFPVELRQIVIPDLGVADRCVSCHVGMAPGEKGLPGDKALAPHPPVVHDPATFGCTTCHGGQGRATTAADAHGQVEHWPEPMLPRRYLYASCGTCHTHLAVPNAEQLARGRGAFERHDCLACHRVDGRGGTLRPGGQGGLEGPDLSRAGARGWRADWYAHHQRERERAAGGPWRASFSDVPATDRAAIDVYLASRVAAPGLVEAKALFHSLGCRGCHAVGGVGGADGPDLTRVGQRDPGQRSWVGVQGEHTLANWFQQHFRAPARVTAGSLMPELGLSEQQIDGLTFYLFSLRRTSLGDAWHPRDRVRAEKLGEREFATDGATLYGTFCAACHGQGGEGMRYPGLAPFPAIGNPDFLEIAPDDLIVQTVRSGRPGRRMPAWGEQEGGLRPAEIDAVVRYVRGLGAVAYKPDGRPPRWARGDPAQGARLYASACAGCHGEKGQGGEGPALANPVLLRAATDGYLAETVRRGRRGTAMLGFATPTPTRRALGAGEIEAVVSFIRTWERAQDRERKP
ncbi:MAG TPA: c-type cytochrome [Anaeromyxobacteraceae bacterium]|nr:c-type cytochrome [Anaeromyxobacteraceae bacterium]